MIQIKVRQDCQCVKEFEVPNPRCALCQGAGWVENWIDLVQLVRAIERGEPIEAFVNLEVQLESWRR